TVRASIGISHWASSYVVYVAFTRHRVSISASVHSPVPVLLPVPVFCPSPGTFSIKCCAIQCVPEHKRGYRGAEEETSVATEITRLEPRCTEVSSPHADRSQIGR